MRCKCYFCGHKVELRYTGRTSNSNRHNAVFLAAFKLATSATPEFLRSCFANIAGRKFICAYHYISAAQYILAEVFAGGGKLSVTEDDLIYIDSGAIPTQFLAELNDALTFTDGVTVSAVDVTKYLNVYLKKYYVHGCWSFPQASNPDEERSEDVENKPEEAPSSSGRRPESMECQTSDDMPTLERNSEFLAEELLSTSNKHEDLGSSDEAVNGFCSPSGAQCGSDGKDLLRLEETDPALLDRFFVVQGRKLLELFYVNGCGCEYNTEIGTICLRKHPSGDVPIIEFIAQGDEPEVLLAFNMAFVCLRKAGLHSFRLSHVRIENGMLEDWSAIPDVPPYCSCGP